MSENTSSIVVDIADDATSGCNGSRISVVQSTTPQERTSQASSQMGPDFHLPIGFLLGEQHTPALLLLLLLLAAGIEPNPGPPKRLPKFPCTTCQKSAYTGSVKCSLCLNWTHSNYACSRLNSLKEYDRTSYKCPTCLTTHNRATELHQPTICLEPAQARNQNHPKISIQLHPF